MHLIWHGNVKCFDCNGKPRFNCIFFRMHRSGEQDYSIALKLIKYLKQEIEYLPWRAALSTLNEIARMLRRTSQFGSFKEYVQKILQPIYEKLGGLNANRKPSDRLDVVKHKVLVSSWACRFDVDDCKAKATSLFSEWMMVEDPDKRNPWGKFSSFLCFLSWFFVVLTIWNSMGFRVPLDLRSVVYCTAIRNGGDKEWNFLWHRYTKSNVGTEKTLILSALGCSREIWLLQRYVDQVLSFSYIAKRWKCFIRFSGIWIGLWTNRPVYVSKIVPPYSQMLHATMQGFCLPNRSYSTKSMKSIKSM